MKKSEEVNHRQRIIIYLVVAGLIIIAFFMILVLRFYRQKKKANLLLAKQKQEIEIQRDHIEEQKAEIMDSIHYAKRIQQAVLPHEDYAKNILKDYFILFKPRDIVSGDFYWAAKIGEFTVVTAADCTGHGVPGAFMSMLGIAFLNEIVRKEEVKEPGQVLNHLRMYIIDSLKQKGVSGEQKDGMDMSLCVMKDGSNELLFAGANNPLWIIRNSKLAQIATIENPDEVIEEIKASKMPVAIYMKMDDFVSHTVTLERGDVFYLFTDGYPDQFGGPKGKKLKYKPLKRLLVENAHKSMEDQKSTLDHFIEDWKTYIDPDTNEPFEQVDDICIVGIRF